MKAMNLRNTVAVVALSAAWIAPAYAQNVPGASSDPKASAPDAQPVAPTAQVARPGAKPAAGTPAPQLSDDTSQDIVVTAQKREQRLSDVPMSITAATGDQLVARGIKEVGDLVKITPGLTVATTYASTPVYTIRGIGFYENSMTVSPTVSVYTDQVPLPYSIMTEGASLDVQRVEILKGPQGTLFGQNSTGGAINFIPNKPTNSFSAGATLGFGSYAAASGDFFVSGPVTDRLSVRVAGQIEGRDGYQVSQTRPGDRLGKRDFLAGRVLVDWKPTDTLTLELNVNGWSDHSETLAQQFIAYAPTVAGGYPDSVPVLTSYRPVGENNRIADWDANQNLQRRDSFHQFALRGDWRLGDVTITSLTSYAELERNAPTDGDGTAYPNVFMRQIGFIHSFSQELRAAGGLFSGKLKWIIGGNYARDKSQEDVIAHNDGSNSGIGPFRFFDFDQSNLQNVRTAAAFGNLEYAITDTLTAQGGVRYTDSRNAHSGCSADIDGRLATAFNFLYNVSFGFNPPANIQQGQCAAFANTPTGGVSVPLPVHNHLNENNVSWRGGLSWKPVAGTLLYANVTRGYKSGAFSALPVVNVQQDIPVTQESVLAYEAGIKQSLFDRTVDINLAGFYYDYANKQLRGYLLVPPFGNLPGLVTIPKSFVDGAEASISWRPSRALTVNVGGTYVHSKVSGDYTTQDPDGGAININGEAFPFTPEWQVSGDIQYQAPLTQHVSAFIGISPRYQSSSRAAFGTNSTYRIAPYTILDLRAGITAPDGHWRFEVYGSNVTNTFYVQNVVHVLDVINRFTGLPVMYGGRLSYRF